MQVHEINFIFLKIQILLKNIFLFFGIILLKYIYTILNDKVIYLMDHANFILIYVV